MKPETKKSAKPSSNSNTLMVTKSPSATMSPKEKASLLAEYKRRHDAILLELAQRVTNQLTDHLAGTPNIDRFMARAKTPERFLAKALKLDDTGKFKYESPFDQIQDLVGARVVVFYKQDVEAVAELIDRYYTNIERKDLVPESESEFGYFGKHYVLQMPEDVIRDGDKREDIPTFFELQIKTLFQHAWSEASHDLAYKPEKPLTSSQKRKVAFTAAQAWGADQIFAELHSELNGAHLSE